MRISRLIVPTLAVAASLFCLTACGRNSDAVLHGRLAGKWLETRVVDCEINRFETALKSDGTFEVKGAIEGCGRKLTLTWRGKWAVRDGRFQYTTTYSDPPGEYPIGESFSDEIVTVSDSEWVMVEGSTGNKSIAKRVTKE